MDLIDICIKVVALILVLPSIIMMSALSARSVPSLVTSALLLEIKAAYLAN